MIVRISTVGQYRVSDETLARLNELDNNLVASIQASDEATFRQKYQAMLELVQREGEPVGADEILPSDIILPPPDLSLEEARALFTGEGLVPG
ncbi:MAG: hypothetical protein D6802_08350 [Ardenticatenia bacterium]|nr:MAG: hypothetical protein D6802_08350 [Ardenticatenia bacterium]